MRLDVGPNKSVSIAEGAWVTEVEADAEAAETGPG